VVVSVTPWALAASARPVPFSNCSSRRATGRQRSLALFGGQGRDEFALGLIQRLGGL
jgi:hypothetical protein